MKRTPFKRKAPAWAVERPERVYHMPAVADPSAFRNPVAIAVLAEPVAKSEPLRNEAYRRAVASLPCVVCGVPGFSQAAHGSAGKGMAIKACDTTLFPACCDRPGVRGCHSQLDQGAMFRRAVRHELEPVWAADTQRQIAALGLWPKNMPNQPLTPTTRSQEAIKKGVNE